MTDLLVPLAAVAVVFATLGLVYGLLLRSRDAEIRRLRGVIRALHEAEQRRRRRGE